MRVSDECAVTLVFTALVFLVLFLWPDILSCAADLVE